MIKRLLCWLGIHSGEWYSGMRQTHGFPLTQHPIDWQHVHFRRCSRCKAYEERLA